MVPGRFDEGDALLRGVAELAEALGDHVVVARALHNLVRTDTRPRDAAEARRNLERMRVAAERVGFDSMAASAHAQGLADLAEWEGDLGGALCRPRRRPPRRPWLPAHHTGHLVRRPRGRPPPRAR